MALPVGVPWVWAAGLGMAAAEETRKRAAKKRAGIFGEVIKKEVNALARCGVKFAFENARNAAASDGLVLAKMRRWRILLADENAPPLLFRHALSSCGERMFFAAT